MPLRGLPTRTPARGLWLGPTTKVAISKQNADRPVFSRNVDQTRTGDGRPSASYKADPISTPATGGERLPGFDHRGNHVTDSSKPAGHSRAQTTGQLRPWFLSPR